MAAISIINIIVIFLIIKATNIEGQRGGYFPRIEKIISRPDSDFDDLDLPRSPLAGLPLGPGLGPGPIGPMPYMPRPIMGGIGAPLGINPMTRLFPNPYQQQNPYFYGLGGRPQRREEIYTAIGYDRMDSNSQMRITITERRPQGSEMMNPMMGLGGPFLGGMAFDDDFHVSYDTPTNWYIQGAFLGSQMRNKAGTYYLVLTESGRTADGCSSDSLGPIVSSGLMDLANPYGQNSAQSGVAANPVLVGSGGATVYASTLEGVSRRQLVGAGLAACQFINNGVCGGYIPFCATVGKDMLPAMDVPLSVNPSLPRTMTFDPFGSIGLQQGVGMARFGEEDRSFNGGPQVLARQGQQTGSNEAVGLLF